MADRVKYQSIVVASGASATSEIQLGDHKTVMLKIGDPALWGVASVSVNVLAAHDSATTAVLYAPWDDANNDKHTAIVSSIDTAGVYQLPPTDGVPVIKFTFTTACTGGTTLQVIYPSLHQ